MRPPRSIINRRRTRAALAGTGVAIAGVIGLTLAEFDPINSAATATPPVPTATATVIRTDLSNTQQVYGSIIFADTYTIANPSGSSRQAVTQAEQGVTAAENSVAAAQTAASDSSSVSAQTVAANQAAVTQAEGSVNSDQAQQAADRQTLAGDTAKQQADCFRNATSSTCAADEQQVSQDNTRFQSDTHTVNQDTASLTTAQGVSAESQAKATQSDDAAQATLNSAREALRNAQSQLAAVSQNATFSGGVYTRLPALGQEIHQGQAIYAIDGRPIPLFYGTVTPWRDIALGVSDGADVAQLEQNLLQLGFGNGLEVSDHFGPPWVDAVERWQAALGVPPTGAVMLGEMIVAPEALRVTDLKVVDGTAAQPGQAVLDASGTTPTVTVPLSVNQEYLVHNGDAVQVDLPDGRTRLAGHVTHIDTVATAVPNPAQPGTPSTNSTNNGPQATVNVSIGLQGFSPQGSIDQEPVTVELTDQTANGVLAVPITALIALAGGGYGVRVENGPATHVVAVQTGLFASTLVQVTGPGIRAGTVVEVPAP